MIGVNLSTGIAVCLFCGAFGVIAQTPGDSPAYDIVSVKPSLPGVSPGGVDPLPSGLGYEAEATTVKSMISVMYRIPLRQIVGGPDWLDEEKFDVAAIADKAYTTDQLHMMFQRMLADRFHLKVHTETKPGRIYALVIAKSGSRLTPSLSVQEHNIPITNGGNNQFVGSHVRMNFFCWWLGLRLQNDERPVVDQTGLTGAYDFTLSFRPQLPLTQPPMRMTIDHQSLMLYVSNLASNWLRKTGLSNI